MTTGQIAGLTVTAGGLAHAVSALALLLLVLMLLFGWQRGVLGAWLICATLLTLAWAVVAAYDIQTGSGVHREVAVLELARSAGWIAFLLKYLFVNWPASWSRRAQQGLLTLSGIAFVGLAGLTYAETWIPADWAGTDIVAMQLAGHLGLAVAGLLLTENLFRNSNRDQRWRIKFLCFALAGMFAFDFIIYAEAMLFHRINSDLFSARGLAIALIVPLIAVSTARNRDWTVDVSVSRQVVFHSATLAGSGAYLLIMAGAGYYVRQYGGQWGPVMQASFLFAAILSLAVIMASGGVRSRVRVFINKHFFSYKYDYRNEWLRVIATMSSLEMGLSLSERVINAVADIVDSPEGELWLRQEDDSFNLALAWNCDATGGTQRLPERLIGFFEERQWVIDATRPAPFPEDLADVDVPEWLTASPNAWLVIPLLHHRHLAAIIVLGNPRSPRRMNWEDFDLLKTVGKQAASYLAAQSGARLLAESRQFDEFNRRFAFVVHDIKNLVSQLSLMLSNAGKFRDNPEFQDDMLVTVRGSVEKMNVMLVRLHEGGKDVATAARLDLPELLGSLVSRNSRGDGTNLIFENLSVGLSAVVDAEKLSTVMLHLIDNALDAVASDGHVVVRLAASGVDAVIEVEDDGDGMSREFVNSELFKPFRSTKDTGFGIGAYESRQIIRDLGGRLEVDSEPGQGTTFRIRLRAVEPTAELKGVAAQ